MDNLVKKVMVVGRDADAWLTALMLKLSFVRSGEPLDVELIELPSMLHPHHHYSVLPSHKALHNVLGLDEGILFKAAGAQYILGQQFINWSGPRTAYFHAYDSIGVNFDSVDFLQYWIKAFSNGMEIPLESFSLGAEAARQARFIIMSEEAEKFSSATYGYHLNAVPYLRLIAKAAIQSGIKHHVNEIKTVTVIDGKIQSVLLDNGQMLTADFYIDASAAEGFLIKHLEEANNVEEWKQVFPCDRKISVSVPRLASVPVFSQISAIEQGWIGIFPLLNRTAVSAAYSSAFSNADDVLDVMGKFLRTDLQSPIESPLSAGMRKKQWIGNCVALGDAAISMESLDATHLHALHLGLSTLRLFFPVSKDVFPEATLFNEKMNSYAVNLRDFQVAHYTLNKRVGQPLWDASRQALVSEQLDRKIKLFSSMGRVAMQEDETFQEHSWASVFIGQGFFPEKYDPLVDRMPDKDLSNKLKSILQFIASEVKNMPTVEAHIEMNSSSNNHGSMF